MTLRGGPKIFFRETEYRGRRWPAAAPGLIALLLAGGSGCYEPRDLTWTDGGTGCADCHGSAGDPAPPTGVWLRGSPSGTTSRGVGAHQAHLKATLSAPVTCKTCHLVPESADTPGHMDTALPAEVTFSGLALARGASASAWDGVQCTVYCHAGTLPGGSLSRPRWTTVDGTQAACGTCHGLPPGGTHPAGTSCHLCHRQVVDSSGAIVAPLLHVDGQVQVTGTTRCNGCHGGPANAAPPVDTRGNSAATARGVGAHQAHVTASATHAGLDCSECHVKPKSVADPGHMDSPLPAEVVFGSRAKGGERTPPLGLKPTWSASTLTCAATYCHALNGGGVPAPAWNAGQKMVCGSCHGLPPARALSGATHPPSALSVCTTCHPAVIDASGSIIDATRHINGRTDFN